MIHVGESTQQKNESRTAPACPVHYHSPFFTVSPLDRYQYTKQLDACRSAHPRKLPAEACQITTSLRYSDWVESLSGYPDRSFRGYILEGM